MELQFSAKHGEVRESIEILRGDIPSLEKSGMFYYYPFDSESNTRSDEATRQIVVDSDHLDIDKKAVEAKIWWGNISSTVNKALVSEPNLELRDIYRCVVTPYGPYGYFRQPDQIFVNADHKNIEKIVETALHEVLHLAIGDNSRGMNDRDVEATIDSLFVKALGEIFPKYKTQEF